LVDSNSSIPLLSANGLNKAFGGIKAVQDVNIQVELGSITGLIGPNGAGKTTLFNLLCNFISPDRGTVIFDGKPIQSLACHTIALQGMIRTFQVARVLSRQLLTKQGRNFRILGFLHGGPALSKKKNNCAIAPC
jgi:neutral amino acid transport system ATP-binding protein